MPSEFFVDMTSGLSKESFYAASGLLSDVKIEPPKLNMPDIKVDLPKVDLPKIDLNIPKVDLPKLNAPKVDLPPPTKVTPNAAKSAQIKADIDAKLSDMGSAAAGKIKEKLDSAKDFAKNNPKMAALGLSALGLAAYCAATGKSFAEALEDLKDATFDLLNDLNDLGCKLTGDTFCPSKWIAMIKKYLKIIAIVLAILILYKLYNSFIKSKN